MLEKLPSLVIIAQNTKTKKELLSLTNIILEQNYLQLNNNFYIQHDGLALGAPKSAILAEIFAQYLEHIIIHKILTKHQIIYHYRYCGVQPESRNIVSQSGRSLLDNGLLNTFPSQCIQRSLFPDNGWADVFPGTTITGAICYATVLDGAPHQD
jgi:hypothetical protein